MDEPKKTKAIGRPLEFQRRPEIVDKLCEKILKGIPEEFACALCDVSESSFNRWKQSGEAAQVKIDRGEELDDNDHANLAFWERIKKARAGAIERSSDIVQLAQGTGNGVNWLPAAWFLERRQPNYYAKREAATKLEDARPVQIVFQAVDGIAIAPRKNDAPA